jgi:regulator of protease activity HflC (stomatin/prohibitin superfamily)
MNVALLLFLLLPLAVVALGLRRVPSQRVLTVRWLGRYRRTLGPGWHWIVPGLEQAGLQVDLIGHHLHVRNDAGPGEAELYYQIMEPEKAGETLDQVDAWVTAQTREALSQGGGGSSPDQLKLELNRRVGRLGLRVIRCSLHIA